MTDDQKQHALALIKELKPQELISVLSQADNINQHELEHAKVHALDSVALSDQQVSDFCAHLFDGGGVLDPDCAVNGDLSLFAMWQQAVHDKDWPTIRHLMPHLVKSWMKARGHMKVHPGGGKQISGAPSGAAIQVPQPKEAIQ